MGARCVHVAYQHRALAINCHASFNDKQGAELVDWKKGKPVRVVCPHISKTKTHAHKHTHTPPFYALSINNVGQGPEKDAGAQRQV